MTFKQFKNICINSEKCPAYKSFINGKKSKKCKWDYDKQLKCYSDYIDGRNKKSDSRKIIEKKDKEWSKQVKANANNFCQICGGIGIEAHHIHGKQAFPELRHIVKNGLWVCRECHRKIHDNKIVIKVDKMAKSY